MCGWVWVCVIREKTERQRNIPSDSLCGVRSNNNKVKVRNKKWDCFQVREGAKKKSISAVCFCLVLVVIVVCLKERRKSSTQTHN